MGNSCAGASGNAQQQRPKMRPVAQVRPQPQAQVSAARIGSGSSSSMATPTTTTQPAPLLSYNKRRFGRRSVAAAGTRGMHKMLRHCSSCGTAIVLRLLTSTPAQSLAKLARRSARSQCHKCRSSELCKWRQLHRRSVAKVQQLQRALRQRQDAGTLVRTLATPTPTQPQYQRLPAPRVDGKVVAMFRRLGTTLSVEQDAQEEGEPEPKPTARPLRIMSPAKQRPRWTRTLDDDEILLEFDSAISEVLPAAPASTTARRRLRYQFTQAEAAEVEAQTENRSSSASVVVEAEEKTHQTHSQLSLAGLQLPRGLSITLV